MVNKDENTEQVDYLMIEFEGITLGFKTWVLKTTYTREEFAKEFYTCLEEHKVNPDNLPPLVEPEIL